ncbi:lysophospholipid acyltransferase family protein [Guyparkeria sp.]|uniref:lysophospholipid acyltransferase family protein n=1 Tax=Guyparkeria sp. TaxID=2035736 RepID=UPI003569ECCB
MLRWIRSLLFALLGSASLILHAPLILVAFLLPLEKRYALLFSYGRTILWLARHVAGVRHEVRGLEHLPTEGGSLILAKHQSTWETMFLPSVLKLPAFVLKRELLRIPVFGQGLAAVGPIAIDRSAGRKALGQIIEQGEAALASGRDVVIFPEGTRTRPGKPPNYRIGGATLAAHTHAKVIPMAIDSGCLWPKGGFPLTPGTIHVVFGPPIETEGRTAAEINAIAREWIEARQEELYATHGCPHHVSGNP